MPGLVEELLVCLFDRPDRVLTRRQLRDLGEAGDLLLGWGALVRDGTLTATACRSCGDDHPVDLEFDPTLRRWLYYCGSVGFAAADEDDLVTFRFDPRWLGRPSRGGASDRTPAPPRARAGAALGPRRREPGRSAVVGLPGPRRPRPTSMRSWTCSRMGGKLTGLVLTSSADVLWSLGCRTATVVCRSGTFWTVPGRRERRMRAGAGAG